LQSKHKIIYVLYNKIKPVRRRGGGHRGGGRRGFRPPLILKFREKKSKKV
jgi:hypothetical protein